MSIDDAVSKSCTFYRVGRPGNLAELVMHFALA